MTSPAAAVPGPTGTARSVWTVLWLSLLPVVAWDLAGLDHALARAMGGGPDGFGLRAHWLLVDVAHQGGRAAGWLLLLALLLGIWWPRGPLRALAKARRVQFALGTLAAVLLVSSLKGSNPAPCPWDLALFGGTAQPISHWRWWAAPEAGGHCFPAGHASTGFAFLSGWLAFRPVDATQARRWLWGALLAGTVLGLAQQWRGAHFMSHTLWTAWFCLLANVAVDAAMRRWTVAPTLQDPR